MIPTFDMHAIVTDASSCCVSFPGKPSQLTMLPDIVWTLLGFPRVHLASRRGDSDCVAPTKLAFVETLVHLRRYIR